MKAILLFAFVLPLFAGAQDCKLKTEIDKFSKQQKITSGFLKLSSAGAAINLEADAKEIKLLFTLGEGVCFDEASTAAITFDGAKTKSNQRNASSMNCDGIFTIIFRNSNTTSYILQKMSTQKIATIILVNGKQKTEITLKEDEKQWLMEKAACIVNEAKKLIPAS